MTELEIAAHEPQPSVTTGMVVTRQAGFYTVWLPSGQRILSVLRGKERKSGPVVAGDRVRVRIGQDGRGVIEEVLPRTSYLIRPPVANVTRVVAVVAAPDPDLGWLDRLLVVAESQGLSCVVCLNKVDLADRETVEAFRVLYREVGYPVATTSARTGEGIDALAQLLVGHVSTLSGPSGVGKSSLLNALCPEARLEVGEVSAKTQRGRHTTRVVQLLELPDGGLLADTPGFSRLDLEGIEARELWRLMPDIRREAAHCRFKERCLHRGEEGCALPEAVEQGRVAPSRYRHYLRLLDEALQWEARRYS